MAPRLRGIHDVARTFTALGAAVESAGPDLIRFPTAWGSDHPAFLKWDGANALVLISQTLPPVAPDDIPRAAVEIQRIHLELSVLGFVLHPDSGALDFRTHCPLAPDGSVRRDLLERTFAFVVKTCERHAVRITLGPELATPWWASGDDA